ncbi:Hcp family type VI secretion system effector [Hafnia paralvei]|uniref:Hcp family type VI secretion system effector n=1 Tax=Hafnia paralvei TaxID=546367 RepID=UPI003CE6FFD1
MAQAATIFMQIDGVKGTVSDKQYKDWIAIEHINQGVYSSVNIDNGSGQLNSDGVNFEHISFSKDMDSTSTQISNMVALGTNVKKIIVAFAVKTDDKNHEMVRWTYTDCIFNGYSISVQNTSGNPSESISFAFSSVSFETNTVEPGGKVSKQGPVGWNLLENTKM